MAIKRRVGASLLEMMVSAGLMSVVLTCIYALMVAGVRYLNATTTAIDMQQQSLMGMVWLSHDLGESNTRTIAVFNNPSGILMGSPRDDAGNTWVDVSGSVRWPKFLCYYLDTWGGNNCLLRKEQYLDDPDLHTNPPPLLPPAPQAWQDIPYYKALEITPKVISRDVQQLTISGTNPILVALTVGKVEWGRKYTMTLQVKVTIRN